MLTVDKYYEPPEVVERIRGAGGEMQLQRRGRDYEFIYNGVFLMATYNGAGEREMASMALKSCLRQNNLSRRRHSHGHSYTPAPFLKVLIGGLGFGLSLQEVLRCPLVKSVDVIELEESVVKWNRGPLSEVNGGAMADPRVRVYVNDLAEFLQRRPPGDGEGSFYHAVILDTDNGPGWLSRPGNSLLYGHEGTALLKEMLAPGGVLAVWSASPALAYRLLLAKYFHTVQERQCLEKTGQTSYYYLAF